jgi:hypothetical protein
VRHKPALVNGIAVKAARELVEHATASHANESAFGNFERARILAPAANFQKQIENLRVWEFRCAAKATIARVVGSDRGTGHFRGNAMIERTFCAAEGLRMSNGIGKS